jgi:hypothetical protein
MRYRGAVAQRNRNGGGMGESPSWRPDTDAHCYSRALLATLFCAACRAGMPVFSSSLPCPAAYQPRVIRLAASLSPCASRPDTGSRTRRNGICNRECGAAPFRRAHEISSKNPTKTGHDNPWEGACPDIRLPMSTAFHAHCLLLYFVQLLYSVAGFESGVRMLPRLW